jgi:hypothetical protein
MVRRTSYLWLKNDFGKVDEKVFQGVEKPYELIFCNQSIEIPTRIANGPETW